MFSVVGGAVGVGPGPSRSLSRCLRRQKNINAIMTVMPARPPSTPPMIAPAPGESSSSSEVAGASVGNKPVVLEDVAVSVDVAIEDVVVEEGLLEDVVESVDEVVNVKDLVEGVVDGVIESVDETMAEVLDPVSVLLLSGTVLDLVPVMDPKVVGSDKETGASVKDTDTCGKSKGDVGPRIDVSTVVPKSDAVPQPYW